MPEGGVPILVCPARSHGRSPFWGAAGEEIFSPEGPFQAKMPPKALVRRFHKSRDSAFACAHSALVGCSACGLLLPPLPRPCCWHASGHAAVRFARKTAARLLERACAMPSLCDHDTLAVFARRVLHVSAGRRRGAAAYGSDLRLISEARTHGSHRSKSNAGLSSRLTWHDFAYVTMAPWIMVDYDANRA